MSELSPSDAEVAVRSFPRRFRAILARPDDDRGDAQPADPDELARRVGPDGSSAADHLLAADGVLALMDRALEQVVDHPDPVLHPGVAELDDVAFDDPHRPIGALLDQFETTATGCADRIDRVPTEHWARQARVAGRDATIGVLELLQQGVDVVAGHLRAAQRTIDAVK